MFTALDYNRGACPGLSKSYNPFLLGFYSQVFGIDGADTGFYQVLVL